LCSASITRPQLGHEIIILSVVASTTAVEHGLSHLLFIVYRCGDLLHYGETLSIVCRGSKPTDPRLVHLRQHFVNSGVVGGLQHNALVSGVHFINAQWTITSTSNAIKTRRISRISSLLSHSIGHEKRLIWFLCTQPKNMIILRISLLTFRLSSA
jgi:hypothetical protein